jgi:hypothetical protein
MEPLQAGTGKPPAAAIDADRGLSSDYKLRMSQSSLSKMCITFLGGGESDVKSRIL